jgi:hypothetical protein
MISKDVNYDLAIDEWQRLLDGGGLDREQAKLARWQLAGLLAERDMAYHLRVFFTDRKDFRVLNNLKIQHGQLTAQIDHLVLTRLTAYFIESKSIGGKISVNEHGEWGRVFGGRYSPMESPVEQSRRHQEVLFSFMREHRERFMGKALGFLPRTFQRLLTPVHYVAISKKGTIGGRGRSNHPEVTKADLIPGRILEYHDGLRSGGFAASFASKDMEAFTAKEFAALIDFLLASDTAKTPLEQVHETVDELPERATQGGVQERDATEEDLDAEDHNSSEPARQAPADDAQPPPTESAVSTAQPDQPPPDCPKCGQPMVLRTARRGKNPGEQFWGCPGYPKCRGIVGLR